VSQVTSFWQGLQRAHPQAKIVASSLDAFASDVLAGDVASLPVVTQELGDSWLYGAPADPIKVATFREARRFMNDEVAAGRLDPTTAMYDRYMRRLMKGPCEHNWGYSVGTYLPELHWPDATHPTGTWTNDAFHAVRNTERWLLLESEWAEQREWMHPLPAWSSLFGWSRSTRSAAALTGAAPPSAKESTEWNAFVHRLEDRLAPLMAPPRPQTSGMTLMSSSSDSESIGMTAPRQCGGYEVQLNTSNGAIASMRKLATNRLLASPQRNLASFAYMTFSVSDFAHYGREYDGMSSGGGDFGKAGMASANVTGGAWHPTAAETWASSEHEGAGATGCVFVTALTLPAVTSDKYGAPATISLSVTVPGSDGAAADISLSWHDKTATRIGEAMWLSFVPPTRSHDANWTMDVLGHPVNPLDVAHGGTRFKHAVWDGATLHDGGLPPLRVRFLDSIILAPGDIHHLLRFCRGSLSPGGVTDACADVVDPVVGGIHANLHNNLWGTAFPQWYDDDGLARFQVFA
jgi:hypothetical protein